MTHSLKLLPSPAVAEKPRSSSFFRRFILLLLCATLVFVLFQTTRQSFQILSHLSPHLENLTRTARRLLRLYQRQLHLNPLLSRAITAGIIFFIADVLAQLLKTRSSFSLTRLLKYSFYGFSVMGPFLYLWYATMNEYGPDDDFKGALIKCLFEQITLEPICISLYMLYDGILCRQSWNSIRTTLERQFLPLWAKNAIFWLPANFANYYIGTPDLRVVFANLCSLFWNIYFSAKVNRTGGEKAVLRHRYVPLSNHDREDITKVLASQHGAQFNHPRFASADVVSSVRRSSSTAVV